MFVKGCARYSGATTVQGARKQMNLTFDTALICEDVRAERSGKLGLLGVYGADIIVDRLPAALMLSFVLVADVKSVIRSEVDIRLRLDDRILFEGKGRIEPRTSGRNLLPIGKQLLRIEKAGILRLDVKQMGTDWQVLVTTPLHGAGTMLKHPASSPVRPAKPVRSPKREQKPPPLIH